MADGGLQGAGPEMRPAVAETYGPADLSAEAVFAGGFINFGWWQGVGADTPLGERERVRSQQDLYRQVLGAGGPLGGARVLEVGCGLGMGCALALEEFGPAAVTGMDIHPQQLERARAAHRGLLAGQPGRLRFVRGAAGDMPFGEGEFDVVVSVEAAQHFPDLVAFAAEAARVVRPGGRVAVASFFTVDDAPGRAAELAGLLPTYATGLDIAWPVAALTGALEAAGLGAVRAVPVGEAVWAGWDRWLARLWADGTWPRNFLTAYRRRILDYYLVTARRAEAV
ncbi:class I SAM-dependent methyltransferase [Streptomyces sp. NPDC012888]|uniref:class I SAM-dependent methyltransferase n=1 Tax=Streptomyces sp. NPDC012888 TaxID=3364855 RepID=UPI0036A4D4B9